MCNLPFSVKRLKNMLIFGNLLIDLKLVKTITDSFDLVKFRNIFLKLPFLRQQIAKKHSPQLTEAQTRILYLLRSFYTHKGVYLWNSDFSQCLCTRPVATRPKH